jgi:hypothetical protein
MGGTVPRFFEQLGNREHGHQPGRSGGDFRATAPAEGNDDLDRHQKPVTAPCDRLDEGRTPGVIASAARTWRMQ